MGVLQGKKVVLTQKHDFMGPAVEARFTQEGADLIADDRDLTQPGACEALIEEAGDVDVLIANLAMPGFTTEPLVTIDDDLWHRTFDAIVHPLHRLVRAATPQMIERGRGKIVVVGSATAIRGTNKVAAYAAARGAQASYVKAAGVELAQKGIQINLIAQNWVDNPTYFPKEMQAHSGWDALVKSQVPAGRLGTGEEDAAFILFLAGDESDFFVGQVFPFSGGWAT
ncbi:MAG: SDR family oxidoreductase [Pseudomonadota bacterium]